MTNIEHQDPDTRNAVDDTRAARVALSAQTDGFARLGPHLQEVQEEYRL